MARRFRTEDLDQSGVTWSAAYRPMSMQESRRRKGGSMDLQDPGIRRGKKGNGETQSHIQPSSKGKKERRGRSPVHSLDWQLATYRHVQSPVAFQKQTPRPDIVRMSPGVNENRFNMIKDSSPVYSKTRRVCTPSIAKSLPRHSGKQPPDSDFPIYSPNFSSIWKKLTKNMHFDKALSRKKLPITSHDLVYENISYEQVTAKVSSPDFKRTRCEAGQADLPLFMRNLVSWQGMHTLNEKMLRMNGFYPEGDGPIFRSTVSSKLGSTHNRASSVGH